MKVQGASQTLGKFIKLQRGLVNLRREIQQTSGWKFNELQESISANLKREIQRTSEKLVEYQESYSSLMKVQ